MISKFDKNELPLPFIELWENNLKAYSKHKGLNFISDAYYLAKSTGSEPSPDNTASILVRIALSNSFPQKYILLQSYYNYGECGTLDIVSLPEAYHKDILKEYLEKILTPNISKNCFQGTLDNPLQGSDPFNSIHRFFVVGGFVDNLGSNMLFYGSSGDFGNKISTYNANEISSYLIERSGLVNKGIGDYKNGEEYIEKCLDLMLKNKGPNFYSALIDMYELKPIRDEQGSPSAYFLKSMIAMKVCDDITLHHLDPIQSLILETTEGLGREMLIRNIVEISKKHK